MLVFFSRTFMSARLSRLYNQRRSRLRAAAESDWPLHSQQSQGHGPKKGRHLAPAVDQLAMAAKRGTGDGELDRDGKSAPPASRPAGGCRRPPISEPRTNSLCGPRASSGYVDLLRRSATFNIAPSTSTAQGCG